MHRPKDHEHEDWDTRQKCIRNQSIPSCAQPIGYECGKDNCAPDCECHVSIGADHADIFVAERAAKWTLEVYMPDVKLTFAHRTDW